VASCLPGIPKYTDYRKGPRNRSRSWIWQLKRSELLLHGDRLVRLAVVPSSFRGLTFDIKRYPFSPPSSSIKIGLSLFFRTQSQAPMSLATCGLHYTFRKRQSSYIPRYDFSAVKKQLPYLCMRNELSDVSKGYTH